MTEALQPKVLVRSLRLDDIEALVGLSKRTIDTCYRGFLGDEIVDDYIASGAIEAFIDERIDCCRLLEVNGVLAGYALCRHGVIEILMIAPELQRRGLGSILLDYCEQEQYHFASRLALDSFESNKAANAFFAANGWVASPPETDEEGMKKIVFTKERPLHWQPVASPSETTESH